MCGGHRCTWQGTFTPKWSPPFFCSFMILLTQIRCAHRPSVYSLSSLGSLASGLETLRAGWAVGSMTVLWFSEENWEPSLSRAICGPGPCGQGTSGSAWAVCAWSSCSSRKLCWASRSGPCTAMHSHASGFLCTAMPLGFLQLCFVLTCLPH